MSHPNIQQLLAAIWYEGVPGFRRKSSTKKVMIISGVASLFPFYCLLYIFAPETKTGKLMRKPFMKFLIHASSYLFFLCKYTLISKTYSKIHRFLTVRLFATMHKKERKNVRNINQFLPTDRKYILIWIMNMVWYC